jgi:hypothetical protein
MPGTQSLSCCLDGGAWKQSLETDLEAGMQTLTIRPISGY